MISQKLVGLIEAHAKDLAERWLTEVRHNQKTPTYHAFAEGRLRERVVDVYANLGRFVGHEDRREEVERVYTALSVERHGEGFRLSEVIEALTLTRGVLWRYVLEHGFFDSAVELYQTLELYNRVVNFFDRAIFYTARGYEKASDLRRSA